MIKFFDQIKNIILIDSILIVFCLFGIYHVIGKAGINARFYYIDGQIAVNEIQSSALGKALKTGDIITAVNNHRVSRIEDVEFICDGYSIGETVQVKLERSGRQLSETVVLETFYSVSYLALLYFLGSIFFAIGLFVLIKRPDDNVAHIYHWLAVAVAIMSTATWGRFTIAPFGLGYLPRLAFSTAYAFVPALFVHLSFVFPRRKSQLFSKLSAPLYIISILLSLWMAGAFVASVNPLSINWFHKFLTGFNCTRWFFALSIIFGVANFIHSYLKAKEEAERRKLRWIMLGIIIGPLSFVSLWQIPQTLTSVGLVPEEIILLILTITPITFAISIVRYQFLDIDLIFNRSAVYFLVLSGLLIVYAGIVAAAAAVVAIIGAFTLKASLIVSTVAAVVVALLFEPVRRLIQKFVDKKFFHVLYNYRIAQSKFTSEINQSLDIKQLAGFIIEKLDDLLRLRCSAFYLLTEPNKRWQLLSQKDWIYSRADLIEHLLKIAGNSALQIISLADYIETGVKFKEADAQIFTGSKIALAMPFRSQSREIIGFLILGKKKSEVQFSLEDIDLLKTICSQISLAVERIRLQQSLLIQHAETQRLDELNQLKSYFVSSVSHELQTPLTSIKMFAELLRTKKKISQKDKTEYLEIIEGESGRLSRLIKNVLDFSKMERGVKEYNFSKINLIDKIEDVLRSMKYQLDQHGYEVDLNLSEQKLIIPADGDAIVEALTNLISNAIKYSRDEKYISISASIEDNFAVIHVKDKGIGISLEEQDRIFDTFYRAEDEKIQSLAGAGLGLTIIRHIVEAHNGKIEVESSPGKGSKFSLYLPLEAGNEKHLNH